jgi:CBS domain-containing protein
MSVFYVNDPSRGIVTPLSDKFRIRQILDPEELNEIQRTHRKIEPNPENYQSHSNGEPDDQDRESQKSANSTKAANAYTETRDETRDPSSERNITDLARSVMSSPVISVNINTSLFDAWKLMQQHEINHLAITNDSNLLAGLLSEKNILPHLMEQEILSIDEVPLSIFCERTLLSATPDTDLYELAQVMLENRLDGIVIIENNTLQGIITYSDIIKVLLKASQLEVFA